MKTALAIALTTLSVSMAGAQQKTLCQLVPISDTARWHYRTKVDGFPLKCWYIGPSKKPREELYWAEAPAIPPCPLILSACP
jgi:hypothetical protein